MLSTTSLDGPFGAAIHGVDLTGGIDDGTLRELCEALYANRLIVIKDQDCSKDDYLAFGRKWGRPIPHVLDHMRMPNYPEMLAVGNTEAKDKAGNIRNGAVLWHTDQSYEADPATATMLFARIVPRTGGETMFCDMVTAYDDLDDGMKRRLDGLQAAHLYGAGRRSEGEMPVNRLKTGDQVARVPSCFHPLVMPHHVTGRPALYGVGHSAYAIEGMADEEAEDLIQWLKAHCTQERYVYRHRYAVGDIAIFDSYATMHSAVPIGFAETTEADHARLLWRISVRGRPVIYRGNRAAA